MSKKKVLPFEENIVRANLSFSGEDAIAIRRFMAEAGYSNTNVAVRALVAGALAEYPRWGVYSAEHRAQFWEFRQNIKAEFAKKLDELKQSIEDDIALSKVGHGWNPDQA